MHIWKRQDRSSEEFDTDYEGSFLNSTYGQDAHTQLPLLMLCSDGYSTIELPLAQISQNP